MAGKARLSGRRLNSRLEWKMEAHHSAASGIGPNTSGLRSCRETPDIRSTSRTRSAGTLRQWRTAAGVTRSRRASSLALPTLLIALSSAVRFVSMPICKQNLETNASDNWLHMKEPVGRLISMSKKETALKIGLAIKTARKRRGLVQRNIAEALDIEVAAVGMWESGRNSPSFENLRRTAEILRVDPSALSQGELVYLDDEGLADAEIITNLEPIPTGPMDVELLGVSYGGDDGDFSFNGEVQG